MTRKLPSLPGGGAVLPVIAGLFLASGLIRFGGGTAQALTEEIRGLAAPAHDTQAEHDTVAEPCPPPPDIAEVLSALQAREAEIAALEAELDERAATLEIAGEEIARQMAALEAAEAALESTIAIADDAAESDIARLTSVYENMKAEEAAALFAEMDPQFAAGFLGRMRADAAAAVMAGLDPPVAYSISVILAGRNARAPKE
ncbi:MAG: MotE family protein [Rhodovulum sp.]